MYFLPGKIRLFLVLAFSLLIFSGCFQVLEEINLNADGSGRMTLSLNMSESRAKISALRLMDSVRGHKVPTEAEVRSRLTETIRQLKAEEGISNVNYRVDFENYIFRLEFDFDRVDRINGLANALIKHFGQDFPNPSVFSYNPVQKIFKRRYFYADAFKAAYEKMKASDIDMFRQAKYTGICRFPQPVVSCTNRQSRRSANKQAVLLQSNLLNIMNGSFNLSNQILMAP